MDLQRSTHACTDVHRSVHACTDLHRSAHASARLHRSVDLHTPTQTLQSFNSGLRSGGTSRSLFHGRGSWGEVRVEAPAQDGEAPPLKTETEKPALRRPGADLAPTRRQPGADLAPTRRRPGADPAPTWRRPGADLAPTRRRPGADLAPTRRRPGARNRLGAGSGLQTMCRFSVKTPADALRTPCRFCAKARIAA